MICQQHKISDFKTLIKSACCICKNNSFGAHLLHDAKWKDRISCRISLIHMDTAFHADHIFPAKRSINKLSFMTRGSRHRKTIYILVAYFSLNINIVSKIAKS